MDNMPKTVKEWKKWIIFNEPSLLLEWEAMWVMLVINHGLAEAESIIMEDISNKVEEASVSNRENTRKF